MHVPDPDESFLVCIGAAAYEHDGLTDLPAVARGASALADLMTEPSTGLFRRRYATVLQDADARDMHSALSAASREARDTLVLYYAGHGLLNDSGELYLGTRTTDSGLLPTTALPYSTVRDTLRRSAARCKVVIIDCCYSGRALNAMTETSSAVIAQLQTSGTYVLTSAAGSEMSIAREGDEYPAFTGELISLLREGEADGPEFHTVDSVYRSLSRRLTAKELPVSRFGRNGDTDLALARNVAYQGPRTQAPPPEPESPVLPRWSVPGFAGETSSDPDLLGISQDATALAVLLASRALSPPLALGLFGNWGSGKTFFMHQLDDTLQQLTSEQTADSAAFCDRVVSVWFNAWHYAEANVWASLLHQIFESLCGVKDAPTRLLDEALQRVRGVQATKEEALEESQAAERTVKEAEAEVERVKEEHKQAQAEAARPRATDLLSADSPALTAFEKAAEAVGLGSFGSGARGIAEAVDFSRQLTENPGRLAVTGPWYRTALFRGIGIAAVLVALVLLANRLIHWPVAVTAAVAPVLAMASGAAGALRRYTALTRTLLAPALELRKEAEARQEALLVDQQAVEEAAREHLLSATSELVAAREALAQAKEREREAHDALAQLKGEQLLDRYLVDRVASTDYDRYLGVVALAHRDLRDLQAFLRKSRDSGGAGIDRIVLYIDDLDRCPPKVVASVLEAVHLLLALPLFVVVVGVDARWLSRSLLDQHPLLLSSADTPTPDAAEGRAHPGDYLDKIFQLSYSLPPMSRQNSVDLLRHSALATQRAATGSSARPPASLTADDGVESGSVPANGTRPQPGAHEPSPRTEAADISEAAAEALVLSPEELRLLEAVASLVGSSPRIAKRFLNVYRVMKARIVTDRALHDRLGASGDVPLMVLTALTVGFPLVIPDALVNAPQELPVRDWLDGTVRQRLCDGDTARLTDFLDTARQLDGLSVADLRSWLPLVRRYAWPITADA
ncbi:caspase, EACC1-associated type [Streptomyces collinus]